MQFHSLWNTQSLSRTWLGICLQQKKKEDNDSRYEFKLSLCVCLWRMLWESCNDQCLWINIWSNHLQPCMIDLINNVIIVWDSGGKKDTFYIKPSYHLWYYCILWINYLNDSGRGSSIAYSEVRSQSVTFTSLYCMLFLYHNTLPSKYTSKLLQLLSIMIAAAA